jgi:hypothetical protein
VWRTVTWREGGKGPLTPRFAAVRVRPAHRDYWRSAPRIEETALLLSLRPQTVKTRLHRARKLLRQALQDKLATVFTDTFLFAGSPCDRLTQSILDRFGIALSASAR